MYGLPADFDPSTFVGRELIQVSFTANNVDLCFDREVGITVESALTVQLDDRSERLRQQIPMKSSALMALVGRQVLEAHATTDGTLTLRFEGGAEVSCLDESKQYESYHIRGLGKEVHV